MGTPLPTGMDCSPTRVLTGPASTGTTVRRRGETTLTATRSAERAADRQPDTATDSPRPLYGPGPAPASVLPGVVVFLDRANASVRDQPGALRKVPRFPLFQPSFGLVALW